MDYTSFHGHGQAQQPSQSQQLPPASGVNSPMSYVASTGNGGYQQYANPQQQQQFYSQQQQQYLPPPQQMAQFGGGMYQGFDAAGQAHGGHQIHQQAAGAQYVPPPNVWQHHQQQPPNMMYQQQFQQQQMYGRRVASPQGQRQEQGQHLVSPQQRAPSLPRPQSQAYRLPQTQGQHQVPQTQNQQPTYHQQQQPQKQIQVQQQVNLPDPRHLHQPAQNQVQQTVRQSQYTQQPVQQPRQPILQTQPQQAFQQKVPQQQQQQQQQPEELPLDASSQGFTTGTIPSLPSLPSSESIQNPPEHMDYVNLQDIQQLPPLPAIVGQSHSSTNSPKPQPTPQPTQIDPPQRDTISINPMDIMLERPQPLPMPESRTSHQIRSQPAPPQQPRTGSVTPRIKPSPVSSVVNSPALTARSPSITKKSPAVTPKPRPVDTVQIMVAVAEECLGKARAAAHDIAMSPDDARVDEYQSLITTGLACLEASLQSSRLNPRQEARMRLRYAAVLLEETDNLMEAETALAKGLTLCERHRMFDLKYCMQYVIVKVLFQRNHKAALNAVDRHIADCQAFKHVHWVYAFRLLKATFYMELGQTADASALDNLRTIQHIANSRGDNALVVFASISEGLTLLKASKDGNIEKVQTCIAQAAKFQFDPSVRILQLDMLTLLLDLASSINHQSPDTTAQKLRSLQKHLDECGDWHNVKSDFFIPIKKQPATGNTISADTQGIIREGEGDMPVDFLVLSFMTKMELASLVFTFSGLANLHKSTSHGRRSAEFWREGLKILDSWDSTTAGISYGPSISLQEAIRQREWRLEAQAYLNILLGLYAASHCQWDTVKQFVVKLESLITPSTQSILRLLAIYLSGVYHQGIADLHTAISIFRNPSFDLGQRGTGVKAAHRELAMLAGLNRLWIMQHPSQRNDGETLDLLEQLQPLCVSHHNLDLRTAWHNVMAALVTDPPQQLNQQKQHIQTAMNGSRSTNNVLGAAVTLAIMRSRLFENVIGEQALKSALAAAKQAQRSGNVLWQSVADGMLAQSYEVQGQREEAAREWDKATREAAEAFSWR